MISLVKKGFKTLAEFGPQRKTTRQNRHYWIEVDNRQRWTFKNFVTMASAAYEAFCGGIFETNCYLFETPPGCILVGAAVGPCEWVRSLDIDPKSLLLAFRHVDHLEHGVTRNSKLDAQRGCHARKA